MLLAPAYRQDIAALDDAEPLASGGTRRAIGIPGFVTSVRPRLGGTALLPRTEAGEEHNEHSEEQQDHRRQNGPHASRVGCAGAGTVPVDVVLDDLEARWISWIPRPQNNWKE